MNRAIRVCLAVAASLSLPILVEAQTKNYSAAERKPSASAREPITLSLSDLYPGKPELLKQARQMSAEAVATRDSVDYAARHRQFQRAISVVKPPVSEWKESERDLIAGVPEPTDDAKKRYAAELREGERQVARRTAEKEQAYLEQQKRQAREQARSDQLRHERVAEAQRWAEIDALHRHADAVEDRVPYYGPYLFQPPRPIKPAPPAVPTPRVTPAPGPGIIPW